MAVKVAINGFGRIGRLAFRQMFPVKNRILISVQASLEMLNR